MPVKKRKCFTVRSTMSKLERQLADNLNKAEAGGRLSTLGRH